MAYGVQSIPQAAMRSFLCLDPKAGCDSTVPRQNDRDFEARIVAFLEFQRGIKSAETATENKHACLVTHNPGQTVPANTITKILLRGHLLDCRKLVR